MDFPESLWSCLNLSRRICGLKVCACLFTEDSVCSGRPLNLTVHYWIHTELQSTHCVYAALLHTLSVSHTRSGLLPVIMSTFGLWLTFDLFTHNVQTLIQQKLRCYYCKCKWDATLTRGTRTDKSFKLLNQVYLDVISNNWLINNKNNRNLSVLVELWCSANGVSTVRVNQLIVCLI